MKANSVTELLGNLEDYVGAQGKYMPYTKSVTLYLQEEGLKGLEIVDTPGVNDPIQSREKRTHDFLANCDVVLVVSPAGNFMSAEDLNLMQRVTSRSGVKDVYIIASKVDDQFFGSEKTTMPELSLKNIQTKLTEKTLDTLSHSQISPEVYSLYKKNLVIGVSSTLYDIALNLNKNIAINKWDTISYSVWGNLDIHYPDFMMNKERLANKLDALSNITAVKDIINKIKLNKKQILEKRYNDFVNAELDTYKKFIDEIMLIIEDRLDNLEDGDLEEEKEKLELFESKRNDLQHDIFYIYYDIIQQSKLWENELYNIILEKKKLINDGYDLKDGPRTDIITERYLLLFTKSRKIDVKYKYIKTDDICFNIEKYYGDMVGKLKSHIVKKILDLKSNIRRSTISKINESKISSNSLESKKDTESAINIILASIKVPNLQVKINLPEDLNIVSELINDEAKEYIQKISYFVSSTFKDIQDTVSKFSIEASDFLEKFDFSNKVLNTLAEQQEKLINDLNNKEMSVERYKNTLRGLKQLKNEVDDE